MRIAMIASARHPIRRPFAGGLEAQTYILARALRDRGHEVVLFASGDSDPDLVVVPVVPRARPLELTDAARRDPSMVAEPFLLEHHAYLSLSLELQRGGFDVIHNQSLHYLPLAMAPTIPTPMLVTLHTPPTPWLESSLATLPPAAPWPVLVSVSDHNAAAWTARARLIGTVHNGIDVRDWPFVADPEDRVVWSGRVVPEKGPHFAIDAARIAGRDIVLAGPIGDQAYYRREVAPRLGPDARYVGHLDSGALAQLVGSADVCVVSPCWEEPFGLVVIEALATGTPVAGFDRGALREVLTDATGVLAPPGDVTALAAAIDRAGRLDRAACRERVRRSFSLEAMVDRYESIYGLLAAGRADRYRGSPRPGTPSGGTGVVQAS